MRRWGALIFGMAVGVFVLLMLWPETGWLVRIQLRTAVGTPLPMLDDKRPDTRLNSYLEKQPGDYDAQLVNALNAGGADVNIDRLRALLTRFPARPALHAHLLRYLCIGKVRLNRDEESVVIREYKRDDQHKPQLSRPEDLALFVETARRAESLDPQNAFFPTMQAIGLLAQHQDANAIDALNRAADKLKWEEYSTEEAEARWRVAIAANGGEIGSLARTAIAASILFPHYATLRGMARVVVGSAVLLEQQGRTAEGIILRQDVARIGAKMRVESRSLIGSLVGIAITAIASSRPGGEPLISEKDIADGDQRWAERVARYTAYLNRIGHPEEAAWYAAEAEKGKEAKAVSQQASSEWNFGMYPIFGIVARWLAGYVFLLGVIGTLLLGGGASLLARTARIREGLPLAPETAWGIGSAVFALALLVILDIFGDDWKWFAIPLTLPVCYGPALFFLRTWKRSEGIPFRKTLLGVLAPGLILLPLIATALLLGSVIFQAVNSSMGLIQGLTSSEAGDNGMEQGRQILMAHLTDLWFIAPLLLLPALTVLALPIVSIARRTPVSVGLARGFRAVALPLAALLLLGFAVITVGTAHRETEAIANLNQMVAHEGPFLGKLTGKTWPGYGKPVSGAR